MATGPRQQQSLEIAEPTGDGMPMAETEVHPEPGRDLPMIPAGFQMLSGSIGPSHAYVHIVEFGGAVNVHGMATRDGDLIHADRHGAVVVPPNQITDMQAALAELTAREARILAAARAPGVTVETIKAAFRT